MNIAQLAKLAAVKHSRCWKGYEPVPGKAPYSEDSCRPVGAKKKKTEKKAFDVAPTRGRLRAFGETPTIPGPTAAVGTDNSSFSSLGRLHGQTPSAGAQKARVGVNQFPEGAATAAYNNMHRRLGGASSPEAMRMRAGVYQGATGSITDENLRHNVVAPGGRFRGKAQIPQSISPAERQEIQPTMTEAQASKDISNYLRSRLAPTTEAQISNEISEHIRRLRSPNRSTPGAMPKQNPSNQYLHNSAGQPLAATSSSPGNLKAGSDSCGCGCGGEADACECDKQNQTVAKLAKLAAKQASGAWTRSEGQSESGGLNDKGRASLKAQGHDIKPPVTESKPEGERAGRKASFCARMGGMKKKLTSSETAKDPDSRINKALRKWNC